MHFIFGDLKIGGKENLLVKMEREPQFSSIEDLIQYNITWIRNPRGLNYISGIDATEAPEVEETADLLIRLNESGFITVDSQCGVEADEYSERAYVVGYIPNTIAPRLFEDLNRLGYLCVIIRVDDLINLQEETWRCSFIVTDTSDISATR